MTKENIENIKSMDIEQCPIRNVLARVGDKWSILVIIILGEHGTLRFNQISTSLGTVSQKMLTITLKTLEADGLLSRKIYPEVPPRVEYTLTDMGKSLLPAMNTLIEWALQNMPAIKASREKYSTQAKTKRPG